MCFYGEVQGENGDLRLCAARQPGSPSSESIHLYGQYVGSCSIHPGCSNDTDVPLVQAPHPANPGPTRHDAAYHHLGNHNLERYSHKFFGKLYSQLFPIHL